MAVESVDRIGEGLDGIVVAQVLDLRPAPQRRQDPAGRRRRRRRRAPADLLRRLQHGRRRPRAAGHPRHGDARRPGDRPAQAPRRVVQRHALLGPRARPRRRPRRHPDRAGRRRAGPALGTPITEALGITPDVLYDLEINPNRPDAMSVAGVARDLAARLGLPFAIPEPQVEIVAGDAAVPHLGRDPRPRPAAAGSTPGSSTASRVEPSPALDRRAPHPPRACARSTTWSTPPTT